MITVDLEVARIRAGAPAAIERRLRSLEFLENLMSLLFELRPEVLTPTDVRGLFQQMERIEIKIRELELYLRHYEDGRFYPGYLNVTSPVTRAPGQLIYRAGYRFGTPGWHQAGDTHWSDAVYNWISKLHQSYYDYLLVPR